MLSQLSYTPVESTANPEAVVGALCSSGPEWRQA